MKTYERIKKMTRLPGPRAWAGIWFDEHRLEMVTARISAGVVNVVEQTSAEPPTEFEGVLSQETWSQLAQRLSQRIDPSEHRVVTAIPCEDVWWRVLHLPAASPEELEQMLMLQIDNLTPLPLEEVVYSFEPLDIVDDKTRLLVAIARKDAVNARVEALEAAGLQPEIVTVDAFAIFRMLVKRQLLESNENLNVLVVVNTNVVHLIIHSQDIPLTIRSLVFGEDPTSNAAGQAMIREELHRTIVALQTEMPESDVGQVVCLALVSHLKSATEQMAASWGEYFISLDDEISISPALSLCVECVREDSGVTQLNLLPDEWRERRRSARARQRLMAAAVIVPILYVLFLAGFWSVIKLQQSRVKKAMVEVQELQPQYQAARQLHSELTALRRQLSTQSSALEVLRVISELMPDKLKLSSFKFRKDQSVTISGQSEASSAAYEFISRLEECMLFSAVETKSVRTVPSTNLTRFEILGSLKTSTEGLAESSGIK